MNFISELNYFEWSSNAVLVKKTSCKWRIYADYIDINKACLKDLYLLSNIYKIVDNSDEYILLMFMDANPR